MALPTTITSGNSGLWPANVSGNLGPFIYNDNVYVVLYDDPDNDGTSVDIQVWKATDPTSSFTVQDAAGEPSFNDGTASFLRAMDVYEQDGILYVCFVLERTGAVLYDIRTAMFSMVDDIWMDAPDGVGGPSDLTYSPTDDPTTYWGGITVRDDGDIIIVHPGENPSTMGGTYQEVAYSRYGNTSRVTDGTTGLAFSASGNTIIRDTGNWASDGFSA
ncbi:MAG: hypothetical protein GWN76_08970, partial [candidate division Zixibacteria bacterium]|nr:hypothetical protein [Phycisphaerae bacterium]NIR64106.1 hypothetical protein [candidate division Zixibacteria bacterium]NIU14126.1 hypothetical protein [candidate division Zixibacteria bacterium]NIW44935.1 hypothetical protein [Gammaproteobacteria bacterium]NIW98077.1 hypothetical protein [Phycisphaerae bacterium]